MSNSIALAILIAAFSVSTGFLASNAFDGTQKQFGGGYILYSGDLGDWAAANRRDAKINLEIRGDAARTMYENMEVATEIHQCVPQGERIRQKGNLDCTKFADGHFACHIGINLKTGKSINGSIC